MVFRVFRVLRGSRGLRGLGFIFQKLEFRVSIGASQAIFYL